MWFRRGRSPTRCQCFIQGQMDSLDRFFGIEPPIRRPYPQYVPPKTAEHLFADFVAVSRGGRTMIGRTVAFDAGEIEPAAVRMAYAKVDAEAGAANLRDDLPSALLKLRGNGFFEWRFH